MMKILKKMSGIVVLFLVLGYAAQAQQENRNWYFGIRAAVSFPPRAVPAALPVATPGSVMTTFEACASVSDSTGNLLFYTNSENIWNKNHQVMTNGTAVGGHNSSTQGACIVQNPANPQQYYVFIVDAIENYLAGGLKYNLVDMSRQNGLGEVIAPRQQVSTMPVTERLTAVPHANGRDVWIVVHGWLNNTFYSYLLTATGVQASPVVSTLGQVHSGGGGVNNMTNAVGYLRASPNGRRMALGIRDTGFELFDFDPATGVLSNYQPISRAFNYYYGVEFSPNSNLLYGTTITGGELYQFDLQAGSAAAISASGIQVGSGSILSAIQAGPDGRLYVAMHNTAYLGVVSNPNVRGIGCGFLPTGVALGAATCQSGLPNMPAGLKYRYATVASPTAAIATADVCAGQVAVVVGAVQPAVAGARGSWDFGDPLSGSANFASGFAATHTYATAGTYTVTFTVDRLTGAPPLVSTKVMTVSAPPTVSLGSRQQVGCTGRPLTLIAGSQPLGSQWLWSTGSKSLSLAVSKAGRYWLRVTSPAGCSASDTVQVVFTPGQTVSLRQVVELCAGQDQVELRPSQTSAGSSYRWQDGSTGSSFRAATPGIYWVDVTPPGSCTGRDSITVGPSATCPGVLIPNIITPNGDHQNDAFVLQGLDPARWNLAVFNRYGRQVFRQGSYDNSWTTTVPGIYYYLLTNPATGQRYRGWVEVVAP